KPYLFRSVHNACVNYLQTVNASNRKNQIELTDKFNESVADSDEYIFDKLTFDEVERDVMDAINHLPPQCREIFCKSRFDLLSYNEISEMLNISVNTVKTQISRALDSLKEQLKHYL
ncbi:MAG TPA: sigma-70 family RNA polymerase sigma factor, partial [Bacteroidales bacterium]